jgi:hypothetical protein
MIFWKMYQLNGKSIYEMESLNQPLPNIFGPYETAYNQQLY